MGHRRGKKNRPRCNAGSIYRVDGQPPETPNTYRPSQGVPGREDVALDVTPTDNVELSLPTPTLHEAEPDPFEYEVNSDDPEEIARRMNQRRGTTWNVDTADFLSQLDLERNGHANGYDGGVPPNGNGAAGDGGEGAIPLPPGDYHFEPPTNEPELSSTRDTIILPPVCRVMYDWARAQGWLVADGSFSAFILDIVLDHWRNCWGKAIVVMDRVPGDTTDDEAPLAALTE